MLLLISQLLMGKKADLIINMKIIIHNEIKGDKITEFSEYHRKKKKL